MPRGNPKPKKTFAECEAALPRYNPQAEGYGKAEDWNQTFYERMGFEEAEHVLFGKKDSPRSILGVGLKATWMEITKAYRALALKVHPDRIATTGMTLEDATEAFKTISAAYAVLGREFGK